MTTSGFWADGPDEHRRAMEKDIAVLRKRLENCQPEDREQIAEKIDQAVKDLKKASDGQILW